MKHIGIDIGSRYVKVVYFENRKLINSSLIDTAMFYREYCKNTDGVLLLNAEKLNIKFDDKVCGTGYGRNNINLKNAFIINELKAHMYGAIYQTKLKDFVLLDIGGQDSKVMSIKNGIMDDMILNDKCAASCGRYLENMCKVLGIELEELSLYEKEPIKIDSTCAVFGESELIGKISEGYTIEKLAAGVNYSMFKRFEPMLKRYRAETIIITGGVAKNHAIINFIKNDAHFKQVIVPEYPQLCGAIGCISYLLINKSVD
jgi:predicted CoA-substrate-specific enzyme activase